MRGISFYLFLSDSMVGIQLARRTSGFFSVFRLSVSFGATHPAFFAHGQSFAQWSGFALGRWAGWCGIHGLSALLPWQCRRRV